MDEYTEGQCLEDLAIEIPEELKTPDQLPEETFRKIFPNRKTASSVDEYYAFYMKLRALYQNGTQDCLDALLSVCEDNSEIRNKAFGSGRKLLALFSDRTNDSRIKQEVNPEATVPTIYEYIAGLAWYYFFMPVSHSELGDLIDQKSRYREIIDEVRALFDVGDTDFDMEWREKFIREVL